MICVKRVGNDYLEYWLEEGEQELVKRLFKVPWDSVMVIVTIVRKGIDSGDLRNNFEGGEGDRDQLILDTCCSDVDHR